MSGLIEKVVGHVRYRVRTARESSLRTRVARSDTRELLNGRFLELSPGEKARYYDRFAKIFRGHEQAIEPGTWRTFVGDREVLLPLRSDLAWLDWDLALSASGHEMDVKRTYETIIRIRRPSLFFDIGANYGQHSLMFLVQGIRTVTFEPNPNCHPYFRMCCDLNKVAPDLRPIALDAEDGWADLRFPKDATWLGSIHPDVQKGIDPNGDAERLSVPKLTLDQFVRDGGHRPDLIKMDTEGNESRILRGAGETLRSCRPWIIFESRPDSDRGEQASLLQAADYRFARLPLLPDSAPDLIDQATFRGSNDCDFLAMPAERLADGRLV